MEVFEEDFSLTRKLLTLFDFLLWMLTAVHSHKKKWSTMIHYLYFTSVCDGAPKPLTHGPCNLPDCCTVVADGCVRGVSTICIVPSHVHGDRYVEFVGTFFQWCRVIIFTVYQSLLYATGMDPIPCKWRWPAYEQRRSKDAFDPRIFHVRSAWLSDRS